MDTYKIKWTNLQTKIFEKLASKAGEKLSQRDLAKELKKSPTAIGNSLNKMQPLIKIEKTKTINFISFNRDDKRAIQLKRVENLKNIYSANLSDYLEQELPGATIILYGSYSKGEDTKDSDIDIAVLERKEKRLNLDTYEKKLNRKIHLIFYNSLKDMDKNMRNNILNGILLHGSVEL